MLQELEELWPFRSLLLALTQRLTYCVKAELVPLMEVAGVMEVRRCLWRSCFVLHVTPSSSSSSSVQARAKQLYNAGYRTLTHLANADPAVLSRTIQNLYIKQASMMVASAKVRLQDFHHFPRLPPNFSSALQNKSILDPSVLNSRWNVSDPDG